MNDELDLSYMININNNNIESIFNSYQNESSNLYNFNFFNPINKDNIEQLINNSLGLTNIFISDTDNIIKPKIERVIRIFIKIYKIILNIIFNQFTDSNNIIYIDKIYNNLQHIQISSQKSSINKYNESYYININYKDIIDPNIIDDEYLVLKMLIISSILPTITNDDLSTDAYNSFTSSIISNPTYLYTNSIKYPNQSNMIDYTIFSDGIINSKYNINYYNENNYTLYFSGTSNSDKTKGPIGLFLNSRDSYGSFRSNKYDNITGNYIKSNDSLDNIIDKYYNGEWFILKLKNPICISHYEIILKTGQETSAPSIWRVYGSIDGITWIVLDDMITTNFNSTYPYRADIKSNYTKISYICLVVNTIYANNNGTLIFKQFNIYGNEINNINDITSKFPIVFNKKNITKITSNITNIDYSINKFINNNFYNLMNLKTKNIKELLYLYNSFYVLTYLNIKYILISNNISSKYIISNIEKINNLIENDLIDKSNSYQLKNIKKNSIGSLIEIQNDNKIINKNKVNLNLNINNYNKLYDYHSIVKIYSYFYYILLIILIITTLLIDNSIEINIDNKKKYYSIIIIFFVIFYILIYYIIKRNNNDYNIETFNVSSSSLLHNSDDNNVLQKNYNKYYMNINKFIIYINLKLTELSSKNITLDTNNVIENEKNTAKKNINLINNKNNNINSANNIMNENIKLMLIINLSLFYGFLIFIFVLLILLLIPKLFIYIIIISILLYLLLILYSYNKYNNITKNNYAKKYWTT